MTTRTAGDAFAAATAALVTQTDTAGILANVLADTAEVLQADSVGLLVYTPRRSQLELLSSTSHVAAELELYQLQHDTGPCLEVLQSNQRRRGVPAVRDCGTAGRPSARPSPRRDSSRCTPIRSAGGAAPSAP